MGLYGCEQQVSLLEQTFLTNGGVSRQRGKAVAPNNGRQTMGQAQPTSPLSVALPWGPTCRNQLSGLLLSRFLVACGPFDPYDDTCHALIGQRIFPWIIGCFQPAF